jgi:hypothetical protein
VIWKPIPSWLARYEASDDGRIRCALTWIVLQPRLMGGPTRVHRRHAVQLLGGDGKYRWRFVARLVCEAFHGPPPHPRYHAAHSNGQSLDNRPTNLSWKTPLANNHDRYTHGTMPMGDRATNRVLSSEKVRAMRADYLVLKREAAQRGRVKLPNGAIDELASRYGCSNRTARAAIAGESWRHL